MGSRDPRIGNDTGNATRRLSHMPRRMVGEARAQTECSVQAAEAGNDDGRPVGGRRCSTRAVARDADYFA